MLNYQRVTKLFLFLIFRFTAPSWWEDQVHPPRGSGSSHGGAVPGLAEEPCFPGKSSTNGGVFHIYVGLLEVFLKSQVVLDHIRNFKGGKIMKVAILRCHQMWLENPRTKWRFVAVKTVKTIFNGRISIATFDYRRTYTGYIIGAPKRRVKARTTIELTVAHSAATIAFW